MPAMTLRVSPLEQLLLLAFHTMSLTLSKLFCALLFTASSLVEGRIPDELSPLQPSSFELRHEFITTTFTPVGGRKAGTGNTSPSAFTELQMNLCNSGWAGCYKGGKSIGQRSAAIKKISQNVVTVND